MLHTYGRWVLGWFGWGILLGIGILIVAKPSFPPTSLSSQVSIISRSSGVWANSVPRVNGEGLKKKQLASWFRFFEREQQLQPVLLAMHSNSTQVLGAQQRHLTVALFGDSMVDTMGTGAPTLKKALEDQNSGLDVTVFNYGIGAQTIEQGVARWDESYQCKDRNYPPVSQSGTEIIILESFAYNPIAPQNTERYKEQLAMLFQKARTAWARIYFLAPIAPLGADFGRGEKGVNWSEAQALEHATLIKTYLEVGMDTAKAQGIPVIDAYRPGLTVSGFGESGLSLVKMMGFIIRRQRDRRWWRD